MVVRTGGAMTEMEIAVEWLKLPDTAVTVTVPRPSAALLPAVSVRTLEPAAGFGLNAAVTPDGSPDALRVAAALKLYSGVKVTVLVPLPPCVRVRDAGEAAMVKSGPAVTVRATVVVCVNAPDVPVMVTVAAPSAAEIPAWNVTTLVPVAGFVPNVAVTPDGRPEALKVTEPLNPFAGLTVTVLVALTLCCTLTVPGAAARLKSGAGVTVRAIAVLCVKLPETPVIVTVAVPSAAEALAVKVTMLVPVVGFVPNAAVTPDGRPEALNVTAALKPLTGLTVTVLVLLAPCATLTLAGEADRL
jgi:hypothetical protein